MPDKRLIDANALDVIRFTPTGGEPLDAIERGWNECISFLQTKAKTIDAVPVVRCRECNKRQDPRECPMCFTEVEDIEGGRMYKFTDLTKDDGFCHMGAKMGGGAEG